MFIYHTSHLKPFLSYLPCIVRWGYFSIIFHIKKCTLYLIKYGILNDKIRYFKCPLKVRFDWPGIGTCTWTGHLCTGSGASPAGKAQAHPGIRFRTTRIIEYLQLPAGFEPATLRLTAKGSTTVLQLLAIDCLGTLEYFSRPETGFMIFRICWHKNQGELTEVEC